MTQKQIFDKITKAASKSNANPKVRAASKLVAAWSRLSGQAKSTAKKTIYKAYEEIGNVKPADRIPQTFQELYSKFKKEYRGDMTAPQAWKTGTSKAGVPSRDIVQDAGRPATQPKGKRTVKKKGYTSNQHGRFKNQVGTSYWEGRSNRFDVNKPVDKKKVKLAYGGKMQQNEGVVIGGKTYTQAQINKMSADDLRKLVYNYFGETGEKFDEYFAHGGALKKKK